MILLFVKGCLVLILFCYGAFLIACVVGFGYGLFKSIKGVN